MFLVTFAGLLSWSIPRKFHWKWSVVSFFLATLVVSLLVINDVRITGVVRDDTNRDVWSGYSIVYYNSTALFPYVIIKHHNWTDQTFVYHILFLSHEGDIVSQTDSMPDQSEFMHWTLIMISASLCFQGFIIALLTILGIEFIIWLYKPDRMNRLKNLKR